MRKTIAVIIVTAALFASGCATGYRSSGFLPGYSEMRLSPNSWRVRVEGIGFTSRQANEQYLMRRCAELTLEQGRRYFVLDDKDAWTQYRRDAEGDIHSRPVTTAIVIAIREADEDAFDAVAIVAETNEVAKGKLSARAQRMLEDIKSAS